MNEEFKDKEIDIEFADTNSDKLDQDQSYTIYNGVKLKPNGEIDYPTGSYSVTKAKKRAITL